jgi:hypothetical protein
MSRGGNAVKKPSDLPQARLVHIVEQIQYLLYREVSLQGVEVWNSHKEWDSETLDYVAEVLREADLTPQNHDA